MKSRTLGQPNMPFNALKFPVIASIKYDGRRTKVVVNATTGTIDYYTSGNKHFKLVNNYPFDRYPSGTYYAEMMGQGYEGKFGDRIHSGVQTTMFTNTSKSIDNYHSPSWKVFYLVDGSTYQDMVNKLDKLAINANTLNTKMEYKKCNNFSELMAFYSEVKKAGWEGLMIAEVNLKWTDSTSRLKSFVKLKDAPTMKGIVVGINTGEGKYTGMIGSLCVELEGTNVVNVGSGLSDLHRAKPHDYFLDKIVEFAYEQLMDGVPQQPRYKGLREAL